MEDFSQVNEVPCQALKGACHNRPIAEPRLRELEGNLEGKRGGGERRTDKEPG